jgi:D-glycero-alpha-D-manno-heptose-7-phosphate kinase
MIICQTPYRISFFGGGTDYPPWYLNNSGSVLSTTIDKYCLISVRYLPPFFEHRIRVVYSKIENCVSVDEIQHPSVRECIKFLDIRRGLEIHHDGDLPARSGMGSSSSFTVGLLNSLYMLQGVKAGKKKLAGESIHVEQNLIRETVGSQDQVAASFGGFNHIEFRKDGCFMVRPVNVEPSRLEALNNHLMLFYTGIRRTASDIAKSYVENIDRKHLLLNKMHKMVDEGLEILRGTGSIEDFGALLHEAWLAKCNLSDKVTNDEVNDYYRRAMAVGAIGGKITGAGGGGFLLLFVPPKHQARVREELSNLIYVPFRFEFKGSRIIYSNHGAVDYHDIEKDRETRKICLFKEHAAV